MKAFELSGRCCSRWRKVLQKQGGSLINPVATGTFHIQWATVDTTQGKLLSQQISLAGLGYFPALDLRGEHLLDSCYGGTGLTTVQLLENMFYYNAAV